MSQLLWRSRIFFFEVFNVFSLFCYYFSLEKGMALHLNKFESPTIKNALCQLSLVQIGPVVPEEEILKCC